MIIFLTISGLLILLLGFLLLCITLLQKISVIQDMVEEDVAQNVLLKLNQPLDIPYVKLHPDAKEPTKAHDDETGMDAGFDLYCLEDVKVGHEVTKIDTGIAFAIPHGWQGMIVDKSGLASKGLETHGGIIDEPFRGTVQVMLKRGNIDVASEYQFKKGEKVAQILFLPVPKVKLRLTDKLSETSRGATGFGASGK
jgi:dUTP pyrophosphatase